MTTLNLFRNAKDFQRFPAGETVFQIGQPGDLMYAVVEGEVEIKLGNKVLESVGAGGIVGEMALIDQGPRSANAVAKIDSKLVPIDEKHFSFLVQQTPNFALQVMKILVERLRAMDAQEME